MSAPQCLTAASACWSEGRRGNFDMIHETRLPVVANRAERLPSATESGRDYSSPSRYRTKPTMRASSPQVSRR